MTTEGLRVLAADCEALTGKLASSAVPTSVGSSSQASVAAVAAGNARASALDATLAGFTQAIASKLAAAASAYERRDADWPASSIPGWRR